MFSQNYILDHEKADYCSHQIKLIEFNCHHNRNRHQSVSEKN